MNTEKQMNVTISIPQSIDEKHMIKSILDAIYVSDNVTDDEYNFIRSLLNKIVYKNEII